MFSLEQEKAFALHMLAVLRPHIADFTAARDAEARSYYVCSKHLPCQCMIIVIVRLSKSDSCIAAATLTQQHSTC